MYQLNTMTMKRHEPNLDEYWNTLERSISKKGYIRSINIDNVEMKEERLAALVELVCSIPIWLSFWKMPIFVKRALVPDWMYYAFVTIGLITCNQPFAFPYH